MLQRNKELYKTTRMKLLYITTIPRPGHNIQHIFLLKMLQLLDLQSTPISPKRPSQREFLHNRTIQYPGRPSMPINMEAVCNHLILKKQMQKQYFGKSHNAKPPSQLNPSQEVLFLSPVDQTTYIPNTIVDRTSTSHSYTIEAQSKQYCIPREHIYPIQQDIIPRNTMYHPEPQLFPNLSCIPIPKPSHSAPLHSHAKAHPKPNPKAQSPNSHMPQLSLSHAPQPNPVPSPSTPTVMVDQLLGHLTSFNDHRPSKHTGTINKFHTFQHISNVNNAMPRARPTGIGKDTSSKHRCITGDKTEHDSQCDASSHPRTASDPLTPEASSQLGMTTSLLEPITFTHETPASSLMSSALSPSDLSYALSPGSPMFSKAESDNSTESTQSTRHLIKLHGRLKNPYP